MNENVKVKDLKREYDSTFAPSQEYLEGYDNINVDLVV